MKKLLPLLLLLFGLSLPKGYAQVMDSVDVLDYDIALDLSNGKPFAGDATLTVRLTAACQSLALDLLGTVDSAWVNGVFIEEADLSALPLPSLTAGDTATVRILYHGQGYVESYGWGGFHFDKAMSYNLGVGFGTNPHPLGRALMPCRDNFHDKATYTLRLTTQADWTAECGGLLLQRTPLSDGREYSEWRIDQPICTYLVGVSQANYKRLRSEIHSLYGIYPLTVGYIQYDSTRIAMAFEELDTVVPHFERTLGPYRWHRIGYIGTAKGSMEHVNNIALAREFTNNTQERGQTTIAHELGHAWFGNLITCETEADMWINEGGASFCSELGIEATKGREAAKDYYQRNLESVLRTTHLTDGGYRALSPMPHNYTYGSTTYDKGALVWHSLRGLMGEDTFYSALQQLISSKAFGNVSATDVRDSMAKYSGIDLTDFFDFHVFTPGFADYHVELCPPAHTSLRIRCQGVGTINVPATSVVPITLVSNDGSQQSVKITLQGEESTVALEGIEDIAYCILDPECRLSDAATVETLSLRRTMFSSSKVAHARVMVRTEEEMEDSIVVEHHWGRPWDTDSLSHISRTTGRYWIVRGAKEQYFGAQGQFHFVREGYSGSNYPHLDRIFYSQAASLDSMMLLYRRNSTEPWQPISHTYSGTADEGYFLTDNLRTGEYTLAIGDLSQLGINRPTATTLDLFPNPVPHGQPIHIAAPLEGRFTVRLIDAQGRVVYSRRRVSPRDQLMLPVEPGTYWMQLTNKNTTLQSKIIIL